jgi:hypothetical protein
MPVVTPDEAFSDSLIDKIMRNYLEREPRTGAWHVSDLMFPRYAVLSRLYGREPTRTDVGFFFTGEAYHEFLQKLLGKQNSEVRGELHNVLGTADYFDGDILLEIKTSRKWTIPEAPQDHYLEQAGYYCAIFGKTKARIVVIFPTAGRKWDGSSSSTLEIRTWSVEFSEAEIANIKKQMAAMVSALTRANDEGIASLPVCPDWKYGSIDRDAVKKIYFLNVRCPFAQEGLCDCGAELKKELIRKNEARRIKPEEENGKKTSRYAKK